jgi:cytochrome c-type biogenesis protein CcmH/NrfF
MTQTLALSTGALLGWGLTLAGMVAIGVIAWKVVQRQESKDPEFRRTLDADDERAMRNLKRGRDDAGE